MLAARVLTSVGRPPDNLFRLVVLSHLLGNTDLHAKNVSFVRTAADRTGLAPAYDIAMHLHSPQSNRTVALQVNGKNSFDSIGWGDLAAEGSAWGIPRSRLDSMGAELVESFDRALEAEFAAACHPGVPARAWDVVRARGDALRRQLRDGQS